MSLAAPTEDKMERNSVNAMPCRMATSKVLLGPKEKNAVVEEESCERG